MDLKKIKKISWYRQQTESTPYFIYLPCLGCLEWFKSKNHIVWLCQPEEARAYFDKEHIRQLAEEYLAKEKAKPGNLRAIYDDWRRTVQSRNQGIFRGISKKNLSAVSDKELLSLNRRLADQLYYMWTKFFMDIYDIDAEGLIERELVNAKMNLTAEERNVMMLQISPLAHQREERDLLRIVQLIKKTQGAGNTFLYISAPSNLHRLKLYPEIDRALTRHQWLYFWMRNSWAHTGIVSVFDIVEAVKQLIFSSRDLKSELAKLENFEKDIKQQKKAVADKYKMSKWLREMFDFFGLLAFWRDERKMEMQKFNHYLELVGREIARRSRLDWDEVKLCDPASISSLPVKKSLIAKYRQLLKDRYIIVWDGKKKVHLSKKESAEAGTAIEGSIQNEVTEIRGLIACPGKVKGEVVVINKKSEFGKMQPGKILVANMTRPEFVPLMRMAAGIVTDEGGITSHAAVVSRELKVPCIIGTQVATKKLKDGDYVLVNADHGVVVVLEK